MILSNTAFVSEKPLYFPSSFDIFIYLLNHPNIKFRTLTEGKIVYLASVHFSKKTFFLSKIAIETIIISNNFNKFLKMPEDYLKIIQNKLARALEECANNFTIFKYQECKLILAQR